MPLRLLNIGVAQKLQVPIQYIWGHVLFTGIESSARVVVDNFKRRVAITEMKHTEEIAERLANLQASL